MIITNLEVDLDFVAGEQPWHAKRKVYTATFNYNNGEHDTQYCGVIYPWLQTEYGEYSEGGYVVGETCTYTWKVEDIDNITFFRELEDGVDEVGTLEYINPDIKKLWLADISNYMTERELFIDEY
jgi:hypothetical protein